MAKQRPVLVPQNLHVAERAHELGDPVGLGDVPHLDRDVPDRVLAPERDRDDVADQSLAVGDRLGDASELPGMVWDVDAIGAVEHAPSLKAGVG